MNKTKKLSLAGILSALAVILLLIGSLFQVLDLATAAMAAVVVLVAVAELGCGWAFGIYCTCSVVSLLAVPNKLPAFVFAAFLGYYPVIKVFLNRIKPKFLSYAVRIICFDLFLAATLFFAKELIFIDAEIKQFWYLLVILANITFVVFDFALERLSVFYCLKFKGKFFKNGF